MIPISEPPHYRLPRKTLGRICRPNRFHPRPWRRTKGSPPNHRRTGKSPCLSLVGCHAKSSVQQSNLPKSESSGNRPIHAPNRQMSRRVIHSYDSLIALGAIIILISSRNKDEQGIWHFLPAPRGELKSSETHRRSHIHFDAFLVRGAVLLRRVRKGAGLGDQRRHARAGLRRNNLVDKSFVRSQKQHFAGAFLSGRG